MGDMGDAYRERNEILKEVRQARGERNLAAADPTGWTQHTEYHWSRKVGQDRIDYWPSRRKWQHKGRIQTGDVRAFIQKLEEKATKPA